MSWLPLGFGAPAMLAALALLIAIWWLLKLVPPRPREIDFPPTRLLAEIAHREETPSRSPWWLTLLRLAAAAAIILALAEPIWRPALERTSADGPMWIVMDNGWPAATGWDARVTVAERAIDKAKDGERPVLLVATADGARQEIVPTDPEEARNRLRAIAPRPYFSDRGGLVEALNEAASDTPPGEIIWLADEVDDGSGSALGTALAQIAGDAPVTIYEREGASPVGLAGAANDPDALTVKILRTGGLGPDNGLIEARDRKGFVLGTAPFRFETGANDTEARFDLPVELRNEIARLAAVGGETAGSVQLLDERWRRRTIGLLASDATETAQPLLASLHYLTRALNPFANIRIPEKDDVTAAIPELVDAGISVIAMADIGTLVPAARDPLEKWVRGGGVLVRFAGPRLASSTDDLVPVRLRSGDRSLGGSLTWEQPQALANFSENGPFADLRLPEDVTVTRQVLAEPDPDLPDKTWASLADGTPLVTAARHGDGWLVLFHVTADTDWSNLPLSGVFVEMLQRIVAFSARTEADAATDANGEAAVLAPLRTLDGFGTLSAPPAEAEPIGEAQLASAVPGRTHPPGLYGASEAFFALNLLKPDASLAPLDLGPLGGTATIASYDVTGPRSLRGLLFGIALALILIDTVAVILIAGGLATFWHRRRAAGILLAAATAMMLAVPRPASAQELSAADQKALEATLSTRLAYVITGNETIDTVSRRGLMGLTQFLTQRTALEPGEPMGVDVASDELAFYPLIYWPIDPEADAPTQQTMARVDAYMKNGGTVLFDTGDAYTQPAGGNAPGITPATAKLREILANLDIPPLEPVPADHVLSKAFYLLQTYPGRWADGQLWTEATPKGEARPDRPVSTGDGVSPILITSNDFAGAWAVTDDGRFYLPMSSPDPFQREWSFRVGVNIVMYTLTGNYKADQVHIPALLERLGQ
ncbi:hypothetical protein GGD81_000230 [Rhodobium orientis]|uniref:RNA-binding protein n=1 Tax=Rhodobium orientis TaxID=34017 RepID=A0A327K3R1_9HYPH|nr:DUF4159 domain-containing protein [Rhodobium orientis]MBB4301215.1 hypothetical protein [Rhodobium orientis]MBK5951193.1 RNA-binding protein [Rhodobium orientis]RAI30018.1 RNA-binding protein [Rhodobium orientis]